MLLGREFTAQDGHTAPKVAVVNETFAKTFFPNSNALGRRMKFGAGTDPLDMEIVGVVKDSHHLDVKEHPKSFVYIPYTQEETAGELTYYVRTSQDPVSLAAAVRKTVQDLDASLPIYDERTFTEQINRQLSQDRLVAILAALFGGLAALAGRDRDLWIAGVHRDAAHAGNRRAHGTGSGAEARRQHDSGGSGETGGDWNFDWAAAGIRTGQDRQFHVVWS